MSWNILVLNIVWDKRPSSGAWGFFFPPRVYFIITVIIITGFELIEPPQCWWAMLCLWFSLIYQSANILKRHRLQGPGVLVFPICWTDMSFWWHMYLMFNFYLTEHNDLCLEMVSLHGRTDTSCLPYLYTLKKHKGSGVYLNIFQFRPLFATGSFLNKPSSFQTGLLASLLSPPVVVLHQKVHVHRSCT